MRIREAVRADIPLLLAYIRKLAVYERLLDKVTATEEALLRDMFEQPVIHALLVETDLGETAGFAVWYYSYSTFAGKKGLFLEDLFIDEAHRGKGYARSVFTWLGERAEREGCGRLEWSVLDWNEKAKRFYVSIGGAPHSGWELWRLPLASRAGS